MQQSRISLHINYLEYDAVFITFAVFACKIAQICHFRFGSGKVGLEETELVIVLYDLYFRG